ncbi:MAG: hypothetical protein HFG78_00635, partial [Hungatella sp.]|nr:hypothetical protein [Hungatella sp.]
MLDMKMKRLMTGLCLWAGILLCCGCQAKGSTAGPGESGEEQARTAGREAGDSGNEREQERARGRWDSQEEEEVQDSGSAAFGTPVSTQSGPAAESGEEQEADQEDEKLSEE